MRRPGRSRRLHLDAAGGEAPLPGGTRRHIPRSRRGCDDWDSRGVYMCTQPVVRPHSLEGHASKVQLRACIEKETPQSSNRESRMRQLGQSRRLHLYTAGGEAPLTGGNRLQEIQLRARLEKETKQANNREQRMRRLGQSRRLHLQAAGVGAPLTGGTRLQEVQLRARLEEETPCYPPTERTPRRWSAAGRLQAGRALGPSPPQGGPNRPLEARRLRPSAQFGGCGEHREDDKQLHCGASLCNESAHPSRGTGRELV